jgi:hypothetical protein
MRDTPNPGSREAVAQGCTCPVLDNHHGRGAYMDAAGLLHFWFNLSCPLHGNHAPETPDGNHESEPE